MNAKNIAVLGATGMVGQTLLNLLQERKFPVKKVFALASARSAGKQITVGDWTLTVEDVSAFDFSQVEIAFFSAGGDVSKQWVPVATQAGCLVIDNTSHFRNEPDVPLVVPEVNPHQIANAHGNLIANPNCSTIQMVVALKPIYDAVGITRINVATYQAVSGAGRKGGDALRSESEAILAGNPIAPTAFTKTIAFNCIPEIDAFQENGYTREEMKMIWETQKILEDKNILVNPTAVRVPVFCGHAEAIHIETVDKITAKQAIDCLSKAPGITVLAEGYPTQRDSGDGQDDVYVGRIREDISHPKGLNLWVVSDNVRKGAALNAIQIAEEILSA